MVKARKEIIEDDMHVEGDANKPTKSSKFKVEFLGAKDKKMDTSNAETGPFDETKAVETQETQQINLQSYQLARDISRRQTRAPVRYGSTDLIAYARMSAEDMSIEEPFSYSKAIESENCDKWIKAMRKEMDSL